MEKFNDKQLFAIELMAKKEYENITIDEIALQVGCSKRSLLYWSKDEQFKRAVSKRSLDLIQDLAPIIYKSTAELLQSNDDRAKAKGIDVFLKSMDRADQLKKEEEKNEPEIDIDKFIEELDIFPSLKKCKYNHLRYYKQCRKKAIERIDIEIIKLMDSIKAMELLEGGTNEAEIEQLLNTWVATDEDKINVIKLMAASLEVDIKKISVENTEEKN